MPAVPGRRSAGCPPRRWCPRLRTDPEFCPRRRRARHRANAEAATVRRGPRNRASHGASFSDIENHFHVLLRLPDEGCQRKNENENDFHCRDGPRSVINRGDDFPAPLRAAAGAGIRLPARLQGRRRRQHRHRRRTGTGGNGSARRRRRRRDLARGAARRVRDLRRRIRCRDFRTKPAALDAAASAYATTPDAATRDAARAGIQAMARQLAGDWNPIQFGPDRARDGARRQRLPRQHLHLAERGPLPDRAETSSRAPTSRVATLPHEQAGAWDRSSTCCSTRAWTPRVHQSGRAGRPCQPMRCDTRKRAYAGAARRTMLAVRAVRSTRRGTRPRELRPDDADGRPRQRRLSRRRRSRSSRSASRSSTSTGWCKDKKLGIPLGLDTVAATARRRRRRRFASSPCTRAARRQTSRANLDGFAAWPRGARPATPGWASTICWTTSAPPTPRAGCAPRWPRPMPRVAAIGEPDLPEALLERPGFRRRRCATRSARSRPITQDRDLHDCSTSRIGHPDGSGLPDMRTGATARAGRGPGPRWRRPATSRRWRRSGSAFGLIVVVVRAALPRLRLDRRAAS